MSLVGVKGMSGRTRLLSGIMKHAGATTVEIIVGTLLILCLSLVAPFFIQAIFDKAVVHGSLDSLQLLILGYIAVSFFEAIVTFLRNMMAIRVGSKLDADLSVRTFRHFLSLPLDYFEKAQSGHILARMRELETIRKFIEGPAAILFLDVCAGAALLALMVFLNFSLALVVLIFTPVYLLTSAVVLPRLRRELKDSWTSGSACQATLVEVIAGINAIKLFSLEKAIGAKWEAQIVEHIRAHSAASMSAAMGAQAVTCTNKILIASIYWVGSISVIEQRMTVGELVAFTMLANAVSAPVGRLALLWQELQQFRQSMGTVEEILATPVDIGAAANGRLGSVLRGEVEFRDVDFRYETSPSLILKSLNFRIKAGEFVGIAGASGSGKSTIAKILLGIYRTQRGSVYVDGYNVNDFSPIDFRRSIGFVSQDIFLFRSSVFQNIALGCPQANMEIVIQAARLAGAHEFVSALPNGYETVLDERAVNLSGGQRQKIAIARALVRNPQILVFDEATSALDYASERHFLSKLDEFRVGRTVILIAHRYATLRGADRIVMISDGAVVEEGRPVDLSNSRGAYSRLLANAD